MRIGTITGSPAFPAPGQPRTSDSSGGAFKDLLIDALKQVNDLVAEADRATAALATGRGVELHQVMIATEKANLALQLTLQVRNKVLEAYQEVMRMPV